MKKNLVVIPGAFPIKSRNKILQKLIYKFYKRYNLTPRYEDHHIKVIVKKFYKYYKRIYFLDYNRNLRKLFSKRNEDLVRIFLNRIKNYDIIALSFGGYLIQKVMKKLKNKPRKVILLGSLNLDKNIKFPEKVKIINIYSSSDKFIKEAIKILSKKRGSQLLKNAHSNIDLPGLGHIQLFEMRLRLNSKKYKHKTIFSILRDILSK